MKNKSLTSFSNHLDLQYGKPGTESRKYYEESFEVFKKKFCFNGLIKRIVNQNNIPCDNIKL